MKTLQVRIMTREMISILVEIDRQVKNMTTFFRIFFIFLFVKHE